jgi:hypothetical protein
MGFRRQKAAGRKQLATFEAPGRRVDKRARQRDALNDPVEAPDRIRPDDGDLFPAGPTKQRGDFGGQLVWSGPPPWVDG